MSENTSEQPPSLSKQEIEEMLNKTQLTLEVNQAFALNSLLSGTSFRFDLFEASKKKWIHHKNKTKKKAVKTSKPPEYFAIPPSVGDELPSNAPGSMGSFNDAELAQNDLEGGFGRRTSRRERKPATKQDLGYEEPKPIKGVKLSGASREIFRKCEELINSMKDSFSRIPELASFSSQFEEEINNLRDGKYMSTSMLGNSIRKLMNGIVTKFSSNPILANRVMEMINKFEESFASIDEKVLFEENKLDSYLARKKSGSYSSKKKFMKSGARSDEDYDRPMSSEEKKNLSRAIRNLTATQLKGIISIVKDMFPEKNGMLEFDIDILPPNKWRELEGYVMKVKNEGKKPQRVGGVVSPAGLTKQK